MTERPSQENIDQWHRWFAVECNNTAWDLISKPERTAAEGADMLFVAYASAYHWFKIGPELNQARAVLLLAHTHSMLGQGEQAMQYAHSALPYFQAGNGEDWDLAFAHLEVALAAAVSGDRESHAHYYRLARELGEAIHEAEDQEIFLKEFSRIPVP